ncbi:CaiB/BaiF CoA transferase family protein [Tropicibacter naphthalenivorans]|uniref:Formyl-coenzyme A transferase n=1 Tax=Tropicibacter naphthalenivorans TaxID=441103 RepID=A0A0N7M0T5_9RHOB|nr:CaiB/BaiF CoA-transferase family protein [Tropicibacter naphthalenivorans]CUH81361.1 Formyl-coenzyme A transferase [Tropicibacter naphthalenivorans]SMC98586.1 CoA-transferase family III [Tropicibacter naphthalenivorans]
MQTATPLKGIRVLELGAYISGPYAGALLASLGADVVKVEAPSGDAFRRGVGTQSHYFVQANSGKQSISVDLKSPDGIAMIKALLPQFDVLIENSRPGVMDRLGLGADVVRARTGGGTVVKTSLLDAMSALTVDAMTQTFETGQSPHRESRHPTAQSFALTTRDGAAIAVHMSGLEKFWQGFVRAIDRPDLLEDPRFTTYPDRKRHYYDLRPIAEAEFAKRDQAEWRDRLRDADVPYAPVVTGLELTEHPQVQWLDLYEDAREDGLRVMRGPWRFDGARNPKATTAPAIGEHTRDYALRVLPEAEVDRLIAAGVLVQAQEA